MGENTGNLVSESPRRQTHERSTVPPAGVSSPSSSSDGASSPRHYRGSRRRRASIKQPWTLEQDSQLRELVTAHGRGRWSAVASTLSDRTPKQCRERWLNHLDPSISRRVWTREEDARLIDLHAEFGNAWVRIAEQMPGRSDNSVKNHWHSSSIRKLLGEQSGEAKSGSDSDGDNLRPRSGSSVSGSPKEAWGPMSNDGYTLQKDDLDAFLDGIDLDELQDG